LDFLRNYSANRVITDLDNGLKPFIIDVRSNGGKISRR